NLSLPKPRPGRHLRLPKLRLPVLTPAEKTALLAVVLVLAGGTGLRVWEHSGVEIGPVHDWDGLRALVTKSRAEWNATKHAEEGMGGRGFPCVDDSPSGYFGGFAHKGSPSGEAHGG